MTTTTTSSPQPARESGEGTSRRTVLKAAAWSVPVIAVAVAAPAATASGGEANLTTGFFEASWETLGGVQYLRTYLKLDNYWNNNATEQTAVTSIAVTFDVQNEALADPLEAITLEFDDPASLVGTWSYTGASAPSAGVTRLSFSWTGSLDPRTPNISTVLEWNTRAGAAVTTGSGFDTLVTGTATSPQAASSLTFSDTTGIPG